MAKMPLWFVKDYSNSQIVTKKQAEWDAYQAGLRGAAQEASEQTESVLEIEIEGDEIVFEAEDGEDYIFTPEEVRH